MPIQECLLCGQVRSIGLMFRWCQECNDTYPEPKKRLAEVIRERGLTAKGPLVYRPEE